MRHLNESSVFLRVELFDIDLTLSQLHIDLSAGWSRQTIWCEKVAGSKIVGHLPLRNTNVAIKGSRCVRFQLR
jgi:hypothetical protein